MFLSALLKSAKLSALIALTAFLLAPPSQAQTQHGDLALRVTEMLEDEHFLKEPFNNDMSKKVLDTYLNMLDFSKIYFTKEDVDGFRAKHEQTIDDNVRNEAIPAAYEIYATYQERIRSRVKMAKELTKPGTFTYDSDRTVDISRKDGDWAPAGEAHDQLWRNLIEGDLIREKLIADALAEEEAEEAKKREEDGLPPKEKDPNAKPKMTIYEKVADRYDRILKRVNENNVEDVATLFIKSIARAYDPHSEYFSQQQYDNFRIGMNKSLKGIGAMLQKDEDQGGATIEGLVVGGPAFKGGDLEVKDRVIGVAQGEDGDFVDVVEMKLSDIVDLIRGEIESVVRLKVIPQGETTKIKLVNIVRDKVDLKDALATADLIITKDPKGNEQKIGWITLPSFYADMDGGQTSTTTDVRRLLTRLSIEGIDGLVVDLQDNGGGSLEEAINMTGLFIRKGPVVQSVDWRGQRDQKSSKNGEAMYNGPMIVLINKASASASEIFAAALQDYGRAVVVGDTTTFGKGTVQQLRPVLTNQLNLLLNRQVNQQGALKLTIQTFYRINGHSTQLDGVASDVHLPSILDIAEIGEDSLPNALDVEPIKPSNYGPFSEKPLPIRQLKQASEARIGSMPGFEYILQTIGEEKQRIEENKISLNLEERKQKAKNDEAEREARKQERIERFAKIREQEKDLFTIYKLTQDNVLEEGLTLAEKLSDEQLSGMTRGDKQKEEDPDIKALEYPHTLDPYERESINIVQDLIAISKTGKPVNISAAKPQRRDKTTPIPVSEEKPN